MYLSAELRELHPHTLTLRYKKAVLRVRTALDFHLTVRKRKRKRALNLYFQSSKIYILLFIATEILAHTREEHISRQILTSGVSFGVFDTFRFKPFIVVTCKAIVYTSRKTLTFIKFIELAKIFYSLFFGIQTIGMIGINLRPSAVLIYFALCCTNI